MSNFAQQVFVNQPFSMLLGARLERCGRGHAEIALDISERLTQHHGYVHGGVIAYLVDNALTFAGGSLLGDAVTLEFKINYVRPASGELLRAVAEVLSKSNTHAVCRCDVFVVRGESREMCASAQGTVSAKRPKPVGS